ncbi:MAG: hypothetical protein Q8755_02735, partial [Candidatus Phytoplasma australasiaticum]|nr:hypothetical protein [Candidatus Phytoplasma australasiaticum]
MLQSKNQKLQIHLSGFSANFGVSQPLIMCMLVQLDMWGVLYVCGIKTISVGSSFSLVPKPIEPKRKILTFFLIKPGQ